MLEIKMNELIQDNIYKDLYYDQNNKPYIRLTHKPFDTIQGEGRTQGVFTHLIRFALCNLKCNFCDIDENWTATYMYPYDTLIENAKGKNLLITGGEPLISADRQRLIARIIQETYDNSNYFTRIIDLETNGTNYVIPELVHYVTSFNISPKEMRYQRTDIDPNIKIEYKLLDQIKQDKWPANKYIVKFVYTGNNEQWILMLIDKYQIPVQCVYIMPLGETKEQIQKLLPKTVEFAIQNKFNVSPRLHILIYGNLIAG